jgi:hypothetical protein
MSVIALPVVGPCTGRLIEVPRSSSMTWLLPTCLTFIPSMIDLGSPAFAVTVTAYAGQTEQ